MLNSIWTHLYSHAFPSLSGLRAEKGSPWTHEVPLRPFRGQLSLLVAKRWTGRGRKSLSSSQPIIIPFLLSCPLWPTFAHMGNGIWLVAFRTKELLSLSFLLC